MKQVISKQELNRKYSNWDGYYAERKNVGWKTEGEGDIFQKEVPILVNNKIKWDFLEAVITI